MREEIRRPVPLPGEESRQELLGDYACSATVKRRFWPKHAWKALMEVYRQPH